MAGPAWLVDPIIPDGAFAVLYGPSGCYKTFVVLDLAASVAAGIPWLGRHPVKAGGVLYVIGEGRGGCTRAATPGRPGTRTRT